MRNILLIAAACAGIASAQAQAIYYQDFKNCDMLRHVAQQDRLRREFVLPEVNGYKVLKADLHTHTIYSDGQVTPDFRVEEAWLDGLDVLAIADHVEYRKWEQNYIDWMKGYVKKDAKAVNNRLVRNDITKEGIQVDLNLPYRLAEPVAKNYGITLIPAVEITRDMVTCGHFNALFITDANSVFDNDPAQSMRNARAQGALIMENHPGWTRKNLEMNDFEKKVFAEKLIDGIEIMNGPEFYPCVATRAVEQGLFMAANTDIHNATASVYGINGQQRDMTLILARDNSPEAIKEALLAHRTLAYAYGSIAGDEQLVRDFFNACVTHKVISTNKKGVRTVRLTNNTSMTFLFSRGGNPFQLRPFTSRNMTVDEGKALKFTVENLWIPGDKPHPTIKIEVE